MSKKKFALKASAAAVAVAFSGVASAAVDLDADTGTITYATELVTNGSTTLTDDALDVAHKLGFGVSNGQTRYIRYNLANASLNTATTAGDLVVGSSSVALVQGGSASDTYAIFQITAAADYASTQAVAFGLSAGAGTADGIRVTDKSGPATIKYQLYETAANAVEGGATGRLAQADGTLANFSTGLKFTITTGTNTAAVSSLYKAFASGGGTTLGPVEIGEVNYGVNSVTHPTTGSAVVLSDLVTSANIVVAGDFTAAGSVNLNNGGSCTGGTTTTGSLNSAKTQATIAVDSTAQGIGAICYTVSGTTIIPVQTITAALDITSLPATSSATDVSAATLGTIAHDGTVLKAPFMAGAAGQTTFVQLANMGTTAASYTTRCFGGSSTTSTGADASGTVAVGGVKKVYMNNIGCPTSSSAVEFTLAVPSGNVVGTLVRQSTTTGDSAMDSLTGNQ